MSAINQFLALISLFELLIKALEGNRYRLSKGRGFTCIAYVRFADASLTSLTSETEKE